jgi:hypothetical protein
MLDARIYVPSRVADALLIPQVPFDDTFSVMWEDERTSIKRLDEAEARTAMRRSRLEELRSLVVPGEPATLSAEDFAWLMDINERMKVALRGLFETHIAMDPPAAGPCPECLAAAAILSTIDEPRGAEKERETKWKVISSRRL